MTLKADRWRELMRLGLSLVFPPIYNKAAAEIDAATLPAERAIKRMNEAAAEVLSVANQLRNEDQDSMSSDLAKSVNEIAGLM